MEQAIPKKIVMLVVSLLPLIMVLGNSMFIPLIPTIQSEWQLTPVQAGLILTVFSVPAALSIPFIGFLSDRIGRKRIVLGSLLLLMIGSLFSAVSPNVGANFELFLIGRLLQGVGAGGTAPIAMAVVGDLFSGKERSEALGLLEVFNGTGKVISPIIGGLFAAIFVWYGSFYFYFVVALFVFVCLLNVLKGKRETSKAESITMYFQTVVQVFIGKWKWLVPIFFASGIGLFLLFGMLYFLSFELEGVYDIVGVRKGMYLAVPLLAMALFSYWTGTRIGEDSNRIKKSLFLGAMCIVLAFMLLISFHKLIGVMVWLSVSAAGLGLFLPASNTAVTSSIGENERGLIVSLYNMVRFLGVALGPIVFSVWMGNITEMYYMTFLFSALAILFLIVFWKCVPLFKECP
ncbi:MFS transporter [Bacillus alkalicellulosilyticus]|uniref:MFS transporter n=1 Tax=Alkalihalobacterium alkalicellulosilyticum TaxID=1912214 RepID=UPI00099795E7|nr:MFS transporter [Bacillus alkalicellulosilyticus]